VERVGVDRYGTVSLAAQASGKVVSSSRCRLDGHHPRAVGHRDRYLPRHRVERGRPHNMDNCYRPLLGPALGPVMGIALGFDADPWLRMPLLAFVAGCGLTLVTIICTNSTGPNSDPQGTQLGFAFLGVAACIGFAVLLTLGLSVRHFFRVLYRAMTRTMRNPLRRRGT
jgi:hypothetical protein